MYAENTGRDVGGKRRGGVAVGWTIDRSHIIQSEAKRFCLGGGRIRGRERYRGWGGGEGASGWGGVTRRSITRVAVMASIGVDFTDKRFDRLDGKTHPGARL